MDDIFFIWLHGIERLQEFLKFIDSFHETISYTWDYSESQVSFLDVTICREVGGGISADVFSKPTDTHQYLDYRSCHPKHVKQAIPYGQALRLRRICSSESKFDQRIEEFKGYLHERGFQKTQILSQCEKVRNKDRRLLLFQDKERFVDNNAVPLVLNFHPALSGISQKVKSLWPVLHASDDMNEVFKDIKPLISFRRPRNLADNLVRSKIKEASNTREDKGMKKCGKSRCQICSYVEEAEEFEYGNKKYWINYPFDCDSEGVIYVIRCGEYYNYIWEEV